MSYQLYVTGGHGFTEAILPTLLYPSNAVDIVRDYFTRGYQGQHIDLPPDADASQASNLTDAQKQTLLDDLQEGRLVLSSPYESSFALFREAKVSPDTLRTDLPATLRQRLQRRWPGTSRGGAAALHSDSLAPANEVVSNSTEPVAPESLTPGMGPYHLTLAYRWPDGTGVAGLPFTLGTDKDHVEGTLDQNGEARIEGLNGRFVSVRLSSDASDDDVGHQRRGIQASLKELLKYQQKEADALAREYQQMPWHQRSAASAGAIFQGVADAGIGLLRFVDSMADLASPSQTLMDGLKSAWSTSEGSSDTAWHESFQTNYAEARHQRWVKALGFNPGDISRKDIAEAYDLANLVMADPILRESLNDFIAEYANIQHHTEVSYFAGAVAFDLVLIALLAVATGGVGAAGPAGGQIRHTGLLTHLGELIKGYGKAIRKQRLRRLWRDTDLKKQSHLEDTAAKRVKGLDLQPVKHAPNKPSWTPPINWQGPAAHKGHWHGDVGNSKFELTDDVAGAVGVPKGTTIDFVEGSPDFSPFVKPTPAGTSGSFSVEGLVFKHTKDARTIVKQLAQEAGISQKQVRKWLAQQDVRMHHFKDDIIQLTPTPLHTGVHHTGSRALNTQAKQGTTND